MILGRGGEYLTFAQCQKEGGKIRKGEKSQMVVFWKFIEQDDEETGEKKQVPFLRYYNVFHIDQCEGLIAKQTVSLPDLTEADNKAEKIVSSYIQRSGVTLRHKEGDRAFYQPSIDNVTVPLMSQFSEAAEYWFQ